MRCLFRGAVVKGFDVFHGDAPLRRVGRGLACLCAWVMLICVVLQAGCQRELPVYAWETPEEALKVLGTQNNGLVTFEAVLEEEAFFEGGEGGLPCEARVSFHLYAWQHEKVRVDLEKDGKVEGSAVFQGNQWDLSQGKKFGAVAEAWILYRRGIFRDGPEYGGTAGRGMVWRSEAAECFVDEKHLVAREYEALPGDDWRPEKLRWVELSDYQAKGGIAWPTRMKVESWDGKRWDLRFRKVKINENLPVNVFGAAAKAGE